MTVSLHDAVTTLQHDPSLANKKAVMDQVTHLYRATVLEPAERRLAEELFALLAKAAEVELRALLSHHLCLMKALPHDLAVLLANDAATVVATPMLRHSVALTDEDLLSIIRGTRDALRLEAIGQRAVLSESVCDGLILTEVVTAMEVMLRNPGACLSEASLGSLVERYSHEGSLMQALVSHARLPLGVIDKALTHAMEYVAVPLIRSQRIPAEWSARLSAELYERAIVPIVGWSSGEDPDVFQLIKMLQSNGKLSSNLVLRAFCYGNITFFVHVLAYLSKRSFAAVNESLKQWDERSLRMMLEEAALPTQLAPALIACLHKVVEDPDFLGQSSLQFRNRMVEYLCSQGYDRSIPMVSHLLSLMQEKS
jgi:uncharacterized protein (DUF2336 family)